MGLSPIQMLARWCLDQSASPSPSAFTVETFSSLYSKEVNRRECHPCAQAQVRDRLMANVSSAASGRRMKDRISSPLSNGRGERIARKGLPDHSAIETPSRAALAPAYSLIRIRLTLLEVQGYFH